MPRVETVEERPEGLVYQADLLDAAEERTLLDELERLEFHEIVMHGVVAKRTARHFGLDYDYERRGVVEEAEPIPAWLEPVRERAAALAGVAPGDLVEILVQRYPPGAQIGWHRDAPAFGIVVGVSLGSSVRMRFRRDKGGIRRTFELELEPRSGYVLAGEARTAWQHHVPPAKALRYSITFRTLRQRRENAAATPGVAPFSPDTAQWRPWAPEEVAERLQAVRAPWYVAAGYAIDLFLGERRRAHDDIEIGVPAARFGAVADALGDFELFVVGDGLAWPLAEAGAAFDEHHQTWVREPEEGLWRLDVFREPSDRDTWICRREPRIRLRYDELIERTPGGIPYARPEVVLLFKAKAAREKDDDDFAAVLPRLAAARRQWLAEALRLAHPGHRWLAALAVT